jgi:transcriptional pleiotropic regulator of transition state genes
MKATGIIRNVDELGRIVIPKEMRKKMDISSNDPVEIFVEGDRIILTKYYSACTFCGSSIGISEFKGKRLCAECLRQIKEAL